MKILTISSSPYLLVRNSRINSDVICMLKQKGHEVASAVWHHDGTYFLPDEKDKKHYFEKGDDRICRLFPFVEHPMKRSIEAYEIMKEFQPDMVICIGNYKEVDFVFEIKAMYPQLFKWVSILTTDCLWIHEGHRDRLEYLDYAVATSEFGASNLKMLTKSPIEYIPYGPDHRKFCPIDSIDNDKCVFMNSAKNSQSCNIASFIKASGLANKALEGAWDENGIETCLHTNVNDPGEYDIDYLIERYEASNMSLPTKFISIFDGLSEEELNQEYNQADFIVDCSVKSATGLSVLEAMATGCIPIGMNTGRVGEIISEMPSRYQFFVPFETYIGEKEEEFSVISIEGLVEKMIVVKHKIFDVPQELEKAREAAIEVAGKYSNFRFLESIYEVTIEASKSESKVSLDTF